jgi:hypothetical protein
MPDSGSGLLGIVVFIVIVAIAVVVGITVNDHLQAWADSSTAPSTASG